jgi:hypothetical protein
MTHRIASQRRDRCGILREVRVSVQRHPNESQAGVGGEIGLGFGNDEAAQRLTCEVRRETRLFYQ